MPVAKSSCGRMKCFTVCKRRWVLGLWGRCGGTVENGKAIDRDANRVRGETINLVGECSRSETRGKGGCAAQGAKL